MRPARRVASVWRHLAELALTLLVLAGLGEVIHRFIVDGKLPQPFLFDVYDTFMDWYNTAFWAHNIGAYDIWRSVYPPISFVFLKIFSLSSCYAIDSVVARDCDPVGWIVMVVCYCIVSALALASFLKNDRSTAYFRAIAFSCGLPLLFTLERGNLIMVCLIFFILAYGGLSRSRWVRALGVAVTINFKPYLVLPSLAFAVKRRWRLLEWAAVVTVLFYLVSYAIIGSGSILQIAANTAYFVEAGKGLLWEGVYYSTSYTPFLEFNTYRFPTRDFLPDKTISWFFFLIPVEIYVTQAFAMLTLVGSFLQPSALSTTRVAALILAAYLVGSSPGGYTETFLLFLLFLERWEGVGVIIALTMGYLLSVPWDLMLTNVYFTGNHSWLSGKPVSTWFGITLGIFVRPGLLVALVWGLIGDSLQRIARAHIVHCATVDLRPEVMDGRTTLA